MHCDTFNKKNEFNMIMKKHKLYYILKNMDFELKTDYFNQYLCAMLTLEESYNFQLENLQHL